jgi:hypothetical protein
LLSDSWQKLPPQYRTSGASSPEHPAPSQTSQHQGPRVKQEKITRTLKHFFHIQLIDCKKKCEVLWIVLKLKETILSDAE